MTKALPSRRRFTSSALISPIARALLGVHTFLIVTGGAVRVTGSGLGCPTWPECTGDSYTPIAGQEEGTLKPWIEFGNRLLTIALALVILILIGIILKARRRDLLPLALAQIAGVIGQIILGGITVLTDLHPLSVASHFLLSIILIAATYSLLVRSYGERVKTPRRYLLVQIHTALTFLVIVAGTLLTGAGPHAGDEKAPRLEIAITTLAAVHGFMVIALILLTVFTLYIKFDGAPETINRYLYIFFVVALSQGAIGYIQYLQGVPELLVIVHLLGSALVWIAAWRIRLTQFYTIPSREQR
ncbi:MAG: hypothetical protein RJA33_1145 [Actinomycetota bacterium]|jgi:cytochrome c oxidase assembly protein subunit 15